MKNQVALIFAVLLAAGCAERHTPTRLLPETRVAPAPRVASTPPDPEQIVAFSAGPLPSRTHFKTFVVGWRELEEILRSWRQVSKEHWLHGYSHVAFEDRTGTVTLCDGTIVKWLVRPGGLAAFTHDQGETVYLAKELTRWKRNVGAPTATDGEDAAAEP